MTPNIKTQTHIGYIFIILAITIIFAGFANKSHASVKKISRIQPPLVMGIFPRRNAKVTTQLFRPMAKYLSDVLQREVRLMTSKNFETFWKGVKESKYDIVHYNQYHYMLSNKFGYEVILKNKEMGETTIAGSLIVRKDSPIKNISDLKGKEIVFGGGPKAMQSYIVATYLLMEGGLKKGDYIESFAKNPPNAILAAYYKKSVAAGSGDKVLRLKVVKNQIDNNAMRYLAVGPQLPHLPWAVNNKLDKEVVRLIQNTLANLVDSEAGRIILKKARLDGLVKATDEEFDEHRKIVEKVYPDFHP